MQKFAKIALASVSLLSIATPAFAQNPPPPQAAEEGTEAQDSQDIVVTGTLLRGGAPVGSQQMTVSLEDIKATGAANTSDLIASLPAAGNFLGFVGVRGSSNFSLNVNRPTLRYLGNTSSSTNSTLLLFDGHRLPGMGILQTSADLDAIPAAAIERVEIVTDGGSSTYGSDAVGGVMNFITRRRFDGVQVKGSYGFADDLTLANASIIAGKNWENVSLYGVYDWSWHDGLLGADRDWSQSRDWINNTGANVDCDVPNIRFGSTTFALPGLTQGIGNRCDLTERQNIYPRETKHSGFLSLLIDSGGPISVGLKAYYINRKDVSTNSPLSLPGGVNVPATLASGAANPFYVPVPGQTGTETFILNLSPVFGNVAPQVNKMESYGFTPTARINVGSNWQVNAMVNAGRSNIHFLGQTLLTTPIQTAATAGTFNPVNLTAATNAAALAAAKDQFLFGRARSELLNGRIILDGSLVTLPAGDVRVAIGAEYMHERYEGFQSRNATAASIAAAKDNIRNRIVKSVFGEINIPLLNEDVIHSLSVTGSARYDDYTDFGHTFNPKIGVNFEPVAWLKLRGNWGKAFQAPGLSDLAAAAANNFSLLPTSTRPFFKPGLAPTPARNQIIALGGTILPLLPQKAKTWSAGFDVKPTLVPGLGLGATYYSIDFKGAIASAPIFDPAFYAQFPDRAIAYDAGNAGMQTFLNTLIAVSANPQVLSGLALGLDSVYSIFDARTSNLGRIKTSGIDFYANYNKDTGFGGIFASVQGTYIRSFQTQSNPNAPILQQVHINTTRLRTNTVLGADIGNLRGQVSWNFSQGFAVTPSAANLQQTSVGDFNTVNLFFQYNVPGDSALLRDLSFTLNVDNVLDEDPPQFRGAAASLFGVSNGFTLGRVIKFGISKKF